MILYILGVALLIGAVGCFWAFRNALSKYQEILITPTSKISDIKGSYQAVFDSLGPGHYNEYVEVKGKMVCDEVLVSELAERECVYFQTSIEREYEEEEWVTNSEGDRELRNTSGKETLSSHIDSIPFYLEDSTGKIRVDPNSSDIDLIQSLDEYIRVGPYIRDFEYGLVRISVPNDHSETTGIIVKEKIFPIHHNIYILGRVTDENGELVITKPSESGQKFIISYKSEDKLIQETKKASQNYKTISIILIIGGLACLIAGFITGV